MRYAFARHLVLCFIFALTVCAAPAGAEAPLKFDVRYDTAAVAPNVDVEINVLVTITAPDVPQAVKRPPVAASLVIDRSGSMEEAKKIDYARTAGKVLVRSLSKDDLFALTVYDSDVQVLYPLSKVTDKDKVLRMIDAIRPGSTTFLSGGLEKGVEQLKSIRKEGPCRVILLSDGLANRGVVGAEQVAGIGAKARNAGISVSTIGLGLDFNEDLMQLLAQRGGGQYYYIKDSEDLPSVFKQELDLIAASFTRDLRVTFTPSDNTGNAKIYGYSTSDAGGKAKDIELSDLSSGEQRQMMLRVKAKAGASGAQELGTLRLRYTDQTDGQTRDFSLPLAVDIVADKNAREQATTAHAPTIKEVRAEAALLDAEEAHVAAMAELEKGDIKQARAILQAEQQALSAAPASSANTAKMAAMARDEKRLEEAMQDVQMQKAMSKSSKSSAYMSAKGQKQGLMLRAGDKGYQVEKLQQALKGRGFYAKDADGVYSPAVEEAVKKFQQSVSIPADGIAGPDTLNALGL